MKGKKNQRAWFKSHRPGPVEREKEPKGVGFKSHRPGPVEEKKMMLKRDETKSQ